MSKKRKNDAFPYWLYANAPFQKTLFRGQHAECFFCSFLSFFLKDYHFKVVLEAAGPLNILEQQIQQFINNNKH